MKAVFVELPAFERHRSEYFDDEAFRSLQMRLMTDPEAGDLVVGTGGLRKLRFQDPRRGKGRRGGLRVIYYWWRPGPECWLFTVYGKDELADLTPPQCAALRTLVKAELAAREEQ